MDEEKDEAVMDIQGFLNEVTKSIVAVSKGSKLRQHYLNFITMNNIFRAFITHYEMDAIYIDTQLRLLTTLIDVEQRKNRKYLNADIEVLKTAYRTFCDLIVSAEPEDTKKMIQFVDDNASDCKYIVRHAKALKSTRN